MSPLLDRNNNLLSAGTNQKLTRRHCCSSCFRPFWKASNSLYRVLCCVLCCAENFLSFCHDFYSFMGYFWPILSSWRSQSVRATTISHRGIIITNLWQFRNGCSPASALALTSRRAPLYRGICGSLHAPNHNQVVSKEQFLFRQAFSETCMCK